MKGQLLALGVVSTLCSLVSGPATSAAAASTTSGGSAPAVKFDVSLNPEHLGAGTTITVGFSIAVADGELPPPMTGFVVRLPAGMGLAGTTLGIDTCSAQVLIEHGVHSCPPDSAMGFGVGVAEAAFGSEIVRELGRVSAFMTNPTGESTTLIYYFDGRAPVIAPLVFPSEFLAKGYSPVSELVTTVPLIQALPETPDPVIVKLQVSLGPKHLTYYKRVGKRTVPYSPRGIAVPATCPRGGFRFSARFDFANATHVSTTRTVPCP